MRIRLLTAALVAALALMTGSAMAQPPGHAWGKGHGSGKPEKLPPIDMSNAENCDFIAQPGNAVCMLPFPDDYYTSADASSPTGRRIDFKTAGMPANVFGTHISATPYNAADGFSQGAAILLKVPGIETVADVQASGAVPINHIGRYRWRKSPVVVIDANTGRRWPIWVEIDSTASNPAKAALEIHPATNFAAGHRYIVAMRNLRNAAGEKIEAPAGFRYYRDGCPPNSRRSINGASTSARSSSGCGTPESPAATSTSPGTSPSPATATTPGACWRCATTPSPSSATPTSPTACRRAARRASKSKKSRNNPNPGQIARRVKGTFQVPCYLFPSCGARAARLQARLERVAATERHLAGQLRLHRSRVGDHRTSRNRQALAVRARSLRQRLGGRLELAANPQPGARDRPVRDRRDRHVAVRRPGRGRRAAEPDAVPGAARSPPTGPARRALPGPGDDQRRPGSPPPRPSTRTAPWAVARCSTPATSTTTATARAGSWAAP